MKSLATAVLLLLAPHIATAHPDKKHLFGAWVIQSDAGWRGSLNITPSSCQFTLISGFQSFSAICEAQLIAEPESYMIVPSLSRPVSTGSVPVYGRDRTVGTVVTGPTGYPHQISFSIKVLSYSRLVGTLVGVGSNDQITLQRR